MVWPTHPHSPPIKVKSDETETINARDRAVHASRQHLVDLIREHPQRAHALLANGQRVGLVPRD